MNKATTPSKAGAASSPQSTANAGKAGTQSTARTSRAKTYQVAEGHAFHRSTGRIEAGTAVKAEDFKTAKDPTGETEFQRQIASGALVPASAAKENDGGGTVSDQTVNSGAAPSAAQINAAESGDDPAAAKVVDAALTGSEAELTAAADPDGAEKGKAE